MNKININYIFPVGFRCYSSQFLIKYNIRNAAGPFDWIIVDLETSFKLINNSFKNYLDKIVYVFNDTSKLDENNTENATDKNDIIFKYKHNFTYMARSMNDVHMYFNYLYTQLDDTNLYNCKHLCLFQHHNLFNINDINKLENRIKRFIDIYNMYNNFVLFYISRIIESNIDDEINNILNLKSTYNIKGYLICILCSTAKNDIKFIDNCLFIIKTVPSYTEQFNNKDSDNNIIPNIAGANPLNYNREYEIINEYFTFDLVQYNEINSSF